MLELNNREELKNRIKGNVLKDIDLTTEFDDDILMERIDEEILAEAESQCIRLKEKHELRKDIFNSIRRFDVLQELLDRDDITEIMINGAKHIFMEKGGSISKWDKEFESKSKLEDVVQQMVSRSNRIINESTPIVDVRLQDGSRVNVVLPPVAIDGPVVTIRKFPKQGYDIERLVQIGSLTEEAAEFLKRLVLSKYNIFISGGTGSGKTTFLNALSGFIPKEERIITIEDSAELQIRNVENLVRLEVRNANVEGKNEVTIRDLIKTSLRMRPDRIILGEVRDAAAVDMLAAMNTGHDGSLCTGHANSPTDMLCRLETLVLMGIDIPLVAVRAQIASAIDIIVQLGRIRDRSRRVLEVVEVLEVQNNVVVIRPLFVFQERGMDEEGRIIGSLERTQNPLCNQWKLERMGLT